MLSREPLGARTTPLSAGADVRPFALGSPSYYVDRAELGASLRAPEHFAGVDVLVRQTARFPIACPSDGRAFRNSVLAGFARGGLEPAGLAAFCNATLVRFYHYMTFRDARQGMPQVKVGHLRRLPAPPPRCLPELKDLGRRAVAAGDEARRAPLLSAIDALLAAAFDLSREERARVAAFGEAEGRVPEARPRARTTARQGARTKKRTKKRAPG